LSNQILSYWEHCSSPRGEKIFLAEEETEHLTKKSYRFLFPKRHRKQDSSLPCFEIKQVADTENQYQLNTGYFVGVDWVKEAHTAIHVAPKLNQDSMEIDIITMLMSSLEEATTQTEIEELFEIKWNKPLIAIEQQQDLLTPLLIVEYLQLLKKIVKKGLKKSYFKRERNLNSRVKGKVLVAKNIKRNKLKNKPLHTYCRFNEFGLDSLENRLLKKALVFVKKYLPNYIHLAKYPNLKKLLNYTTPAFRQVSDKIELSEIKHHKTNPFYKEYKTAIRLAKQILKRFGYNLSSTAQKQVKTPPFWIDMSKLFELYVLGLLRKRFSARNEVAYQKTFCHLSPDFLINAKDGQCQMVADAKYKRYNGSSVQKEDVRQLAAYARMNGVYSFFGKEDNSLIDCLIIYPDQNGPDDIKEIKLNSPDKKINCYKQFFKIGVKLPVISS